MIRKVASAVVIFVAAIMLAASATSCAAVHALGNGKSYCLHRGDAKQLTGGDYPMFVPGVLLTWHSIQVFYPVTPGPGPVRTLVKLPLVAYLGYNSQLGFGIARLDYRVPLWLFGVPASLAIAFSPKRRWRRRRAGRCIYCGYNLTGNLSGVCPECGERI